MKWTISVFKRRDRRDRTVFEVVVKNEVPVPSENPYQLAAVLLKRACVVIVARDFSREHRCPLHEAGMIAFPVTARRTA